MARNKLRAALDDIKAHIVDGALDDIRHKVVEEPWFLRPEGREVTGDLVNRSKFDELRHSLYGHDREANAQEANAPSIEPANTTEKQGFWHGEHQGSYGGKAPDIHSKDAMRPRNGWALGQDAHETRLEQEQDAALEKEREQQGMEIEQDLDR